MKQVTKDVKELCAQLIDDASGPTYAYQLMSIITKVKHYYGSYPIDVYNEEELKFLDAIDIVIPYLDVKFDILGDLDGA